MRKKISMRLKAGGGRVSEPDVDLGAGYCVEGLTCYEDVFVRCSHELHCPLRE